MEPRAVESHGGMGMAKEGLEYTILIVTGWKETHRNTAKVHMTLTGTKGSSPVLPMDDGLRQVRVITIRLLDWFLLCVDLQFSG